MFPKGSNTIKRYGLIGVGVVSLEVCHYEVDFEVYFAQVTHSEAEHFLLPVGS